MIQIQTRLSFATKNYRLLLKFSGWAIKWLGNWAPTDIHAQEALKQHWCSFLSYVHSWKILVMVQGFLWIHWKIFVSYNQLNLFGKTKKECD